MDHAGRLRVRHPASGAAHSAQVLADDGSPRDRGDQSFYAFTALVCGLYWPVALPVWAFQVWVFKRADR